MDTEKRVTASAVLVVVGIVLAVAAGVLVDSSDGGSQANGVVIDRGGYDTTWVDADIASFGTELDLLTHACEQLGYELVMGDDGRVVSIDGIAGGDSSWELWVVYPGSTEWVRLDAPYVQDPTEFTVSSWSHLSEGEEPTVAVDYLGNPIYGFSQRYRAVSLSPTLTEILASIGAINVMVGADSYSDYPESVVQGKADGSIATVGTYTSPSFELITGTNPDIVFCDGSQRSHMQMATQLRSADVNATLLYPGEDLGSILDNIFIVGTVMNYEIAAKQVIRDTDDVIDRLTEKVLSPGAGGSRDVMISLEPDISPWVSGDGTYVSNIAEMFNTSNVFSEWAGWVHITSDRIPYADPEVIIIITTEYSATQEEYEYLYNSLSPQWKDTDAWRNGEVYVICEGAADMAQRFGPRTAQMAELLAMMLHPGAFDTEIPKIIGDDYGDYLDISRYMDIS